MRREKENEVDESEVEAREIFAGFLGVGLDVIIIMTRVTRLKDERETGGGKERKKEREHVHLRSGRARNYLP